MADRKWSDLAPRLVSGIVMVLGGLALIWAGGHWFRIFIALACGGMVWELARMCAPLRRDVPLQMGGVAAGCLALALEQGVALPRAALDFADREEIAEFLADWAEAHPGQVVDYGAF